MEVRSYCFRCELQFIASNKSDEYMYSAGFRFKNSQLFFRLSTQPPYKWWITTKVRSSQASRRDYGWREICLRCCHEPPGLMMSLHIFAICEVALQTISVKCGDVVHIGLDWNLDAFLLDRCWQVHQFYQTIINSNRNRVIDQLFFFKKSFGTWQPNCPSRSSELCRTPFLTPGWYSLFNGKQSPTRSCERSAKKEWCRSI